MAALYVVAFLSSLGFSIVIPFLVFLVMRFGGNAFVLGAIGSVFWTAQLVGSTWLGALSDRLGRKRVLFRSQLGAMAAWAIFLCALFAPRVELAHVASSATGAFTITLPLLLIALARMTDGVFNGSISVANAYMADLTGEDKRKVGYARLGAATNLGFVVGPLIAGFLARTDAGVIAVVMLALVLSGIAAMLIKLRLPDVPLRSATAIDVARAGGVRAHKLLGGGCRESVKTPRVPLRAILSSHALRPLIAIYFLVYFGFSIFAATIAVHATKDLGLSSDQLGLLFTTLALGLVVTETLILPRLERKVASTTLGAGGCAILVLAYVLMTRSSAGSLFGGAVLYGIGNGLMWPSYLALLSESGPPQYQGSVQGIGSSTGSFASIIGTLLGGVLFENLGATTFYVSAVSIASAMLLFAIAASRSGASVAAPSTSVTAAGRTSA
ncbi:MAG: Tetracycline resistance protein [Myxococcales bacterium]|nr:Tetracycline resistance protein [Myxococcales bacterium]